MKEINRQGWRGLVMGLATCSLLAFGGTATAAINVRVQPSGNTTSTAYALVNEQRTFFGNVEGGSGTYECQWTFSDGTPATGFSVPGNPHYITLDHTFTTAANHFLRLECRDQANPADSDIESIQLAVQAGDSLNRRKNSEIDNGLRWAYQSQFTSGTYKGCFNGSGGYTASTGMALLAFENHGHNLESPDEDIYKQVVADGLQCLFDAYAQSITMSNQNCIGDPEDGDVDTDGGTVPTDHDGEGIRFQTENQYYTPFGYMALVNSASKAYAKSHAVTSTNPVVNGQTLFDIAVDIKDYLSWSQTDFPACDYNAWRYGENHTSIDNSVTQWPTLALAEAQDRWGIGVKQAVKDQLAGWLAHSQCTSASYLGGFGYDAACGWIVPNVAKTAAGLIGLSWIGKPLGDAAVQNALTFLGTRYNTSANSTWHGHWDHPYAMYAFYKAMKRYGITDFVDSVSTHHQWEQEYQDFLVDFSSEPVPNGAAGNARWDAGRKATYFDLNFYGYDSNFDTYTALAMLAPEVAALPPVAVAGPDQTVNPNQAVPLDGSGSFHQDPNKNIVAYYWDFDASNGLWWDAAPVPPAGEGAIGVTATTSYPDTGSDTDYTVTLQVMDDGGTPTNPDPVMTDLDTLVVHVGTGQVAPVAVTNGPWTGVPGAPVTFDGSASFDPNACNTPGDPSCTGDSIVSYEWDIDGDGNFNEASGDDGTPVTPGDWSVVQKTFPTPTSGLATLRVTDSHGATDTASNQILSISLVYGENYSLCWYKPLSRTVIQYGYAVTFTNQGTAAAENLEVQLTTVPTNLTIVSGHSALGDLAPGASATTACDAGAKTADIVLNLNRRVRPTGGWTWQAEFDVGGTHYIIPNLPPLGP